MLDSIKARLEHDADLWVLHISNEESVSPAIAELRKMFKGRYCHAKEFGSLVGVGAHEIWSEIPMTVKNQNWFYNAVGTRLCGKGTAYLASA